MENNISVAQFSRNSMLIVDDDRDLRELIIRTLERNGHSAHGIGRGQEAIDLAGKEIPLLIILDYRLPDMTGQEVIQALAKRGYSIPFVMMTGQGDERLAVEIMKLGATDYLIKDTELMDRLPASVERALQSIDTESRLRKAEEALKESRERLAATAHIGKIGGWEIYLENKQIAWTDETFLLHELENGILPSVDEIIHFYHPEDRPKVDAVIQRTLKTGEGFDEEVRLITAKGNLRSVRVIGRPIFRNGILAGISGMIQDITDRKRSEEALAKAQKLESLGVLAGGIAHDFNNLLGGIYGFMDLADSIATDPKQQHYISIAMNTIERGRHLTRQLLTFAKGGAPQKSVANLFPHVREIAKFALSGSNIAFICDIAENLYRCSFDKNQIAQVIENIVINAKQAMPEGGKIELSAQNISIHPGQYNSQYQGEFIQISIRDYGIGMSKEILSKIFDPFYTTKVSGHGLGLATCFSIIHRHGGFLDVESEFGKGSIFHIFLPASFEILNHSDASINGGHAGTGIFIIMDDEDVMRTTLACFLESFGYTVIQTIEGKETIDTLNSLISSGEKISGMILDLTIPGGLGGKEAISEIRKLNPRIPIFVASGYAEDPVMSSPKEFGFFASICKPFRIHEIAEMLNRHLPVNKG